jgi:hypothetical protein
MNILVLHKGPGVGWHFQEQGQSLSSVVLDGNLEIEFRAFHPSFRKSSL